MTLRKNADIRFENSYDYSSSTKRIILSTSRITFKFMAVKTHEMKNIPNFMLNHILSYNFLTNLPWKSYTTFNVLGSCRDNVNKNFSAKVPTANASPSTLSSSLAAMETMTKYHKKLNIRLGRHFSGKRQYKMMFSIKFGITFVFYVLTAIKIKVILIDSTYVSTWYVCNVVEGLYILLKLKFVSKCWEKTCNFPILWKGLCNYSSSSLPVVKYIDIVSWKPQNAKWRLRGDQKTQK